MCIQNGDFCSHWLLFGLVSVILSFIVSIPISVFTEVSVLSLDSNLLILSTIVELKTS